MEDMELESIVDVPDNPDRPMSRASRRYIDEKYINNMNGKHRNELATSDFSVANNGNSRRLENHHHQGICCRNEVEIGSNGIANSPLKKMHAPRESRPLLLTEKKGKCKAIGNNSALRLSGTGKIPLLDLTEDKGQSLNIKPAIPFHRQDDFSTVESTRKKLSNRCNFAHSNFSSSASSSCSTTTRDMTVSNDSECSNWVRSCGEMFDLSSCSPLKINLQNSPSSGPFANQRFTSQKGLVQNGGTLSHDIASRAKQSAENYVDNARDSKEDVCSSAVSSNIPLVHLSDIVADEKCRDKGKGKGFPIHPSISSGNNSGAVHVRRNSSGRFGDQGSVSTTSTFLRNPNWSMQNGMRHPSRTNHDIGCLTDMKQWNRRDGNVSESRQKNEVVCIPDDTALSTSETLSTTYRVTDAEVIGNALNKRQRKQGTTSRNLIEGSASVSQDSDIIFLGLPGEPSNPISSEIRQLLRHSDAEVVPLSPENKETFYLESDGVHNEELDARARQLEADEKLALELQQQLYYEESAPEGVEMDLYSAWDLQEEEEVFYNIGPAHQQIPGQSNRQRRQQRYNQRPLDRRRNHSQVFVPNRVAPSRSRIVIQSPPRVSDTLRFSFPSDMDLDMRLDILEALEAAAGEFGDMGMADDVFNVQRDFNENDYEMLLALDENNHERAGATANQISSLPQSKVQTTSIEEPCTICLETPSVGDTIRHLPCLHKFHKDCIDPWLHRNTSCPVCKSSIT